MNETNPFETPALCARMQLTFVRGPAEAPTLLVPIINPLLLNGPHFGLWTREACGEGDCIVAKISSRICLVSLGGEHDRLPTYVERGKEGRVYEDGMCMVDSN